jgi:hypothetical protein
MFDGRERANRLDEYMFESDSPGEDNKTEMVRVS